MSVTAAAERWRVPPSFDPTFYLASNPDLAGHSPDAARLHFERHGRAEGRIAAPLAVREAVSAFLHQSEASILEIGPFFSPFVTGAHVSYLDVLDADALRVRARDVGGDPATCPARIDYVGGLEQVDRRFDAVLSCHSVEHQVDFVRHLRGVAGILAPGGIYVLIVPDKRYCFDHFLPASTIADVIAAFREERQVHALKSVIEHAALTTHNDPGRHWAGDHGELPASDQPRRVRHGMDVFAAAAGGYVDVHAWYFTPDNFRSIVETLHELQLSPLEVAGVYDTPRDRIEFCAVLRAP